MKERILDAAWELVEEGVKAITGDCAYMVLFQEEVRSALPVPVFLSSILQVLFISRILKDDEGVGILCASKGDLTQYLLIKDGIHGGIKVFIQGLEKEENYFKTFI